MLKKEEKPEEKPEVQIKRENCTGCMRCALICSFIHEKKFEISLARIRVGDTITYLDNCNKCWKCVENCLYGALSV